MSNSANFSGLRVAAFEGRRTADLAELIRKFGGEPLVTPAMREVAPARNPEAIDFANRVVTGQVDVIIFNTGGGVRRLVEQTERHVDRNRFLSAISDVITIARGPKPASALAELGIQPTHTTDEPHTWREILQVIDRHVPLANHTVGVQEYGEPNASLLAGLEARGAAVVNLRLYHWELPEDTSALIAAVQKIADKNFDAVLFTSSHQVVHLMQIAEQERLTNKTHAGLRSAVIGSIGPDTTAMLRQYDLPCDIEPEHPTMQRLVEAAAADAKDLLARKRWNGAAKASASSSNQNSTNNMTAIGKNIAALDPNDPAYNSAFLKACRREPTPFTPVWLMRQAGRYMAEYRAVREKVGFLELCKNPSLCAEVMVTAVRRLGVDAAIIFSDLLPILQPMGLDLEFAAGEGPLIHNPVREAKDVDRVLELDSMDALSFVPETVRQTRAGLTGIPIIGFAGAPFTLASYVIEGGASRNFLHTKSLMYRDPGAWNALAAKLARAIAKYLNAQIEAGAHAVQIFDSWVGCLGPDDYRRLVLPHLQSVIDNLIPGVPVINFATGNPALVPLQAEAFANVAGGGRQAAGSEAQSPLHPLTSSPVHPVIGVDWRIRLDEAWRTIGPNFAIQGNLDPGVLLTDPSEIRHRAKEVLDQARNAIGVSSTAGASNSAASTPGHIFNLGHGIFPQTPVENAIALIDAVHELSSG
jgi:uroporphyrinogen decarboxylase